MDRSTHLELDFSFKRTEDGSGTSIPRREFYLRRGSLTSSAGIVQAADEGSP